MTRTKLTATQRKILVNIDAGRAFDDGRPLGRSAAGGWDRSFQSLASRGFVKNAAGRGDYLTEAGKAALAGE